MTVLLFVLSVSTLVGGQLEGGGQHGGLPYVGSQPHYEIYVGRLQQSRVTSLLHVDPKVCLPGCQPNSEDATATKAKKSIVVLTWASTEEEKQRRIDLEMIKPLRNAIFHQITVIIALEQICS